MPVSENPCFLFELGVMGSKNAKIKISVISSIVFVIISYLVFRADLPKIPTIFLYNIIIIFTLQNFGFYRGLFFLCASTFLTILISLAVNFYYAWNVPVFFVTFLIVNDRLKKLSYYTHIIDTRIEEIKENSNILQDKFNKHKRESLSLEQKEGA